MLHELSTIAYNYRLGDKEKKGKKNTQLIAGVHMQSQALFNLDKQHDALHSFIRVHRQVRKFFNVTGSMHYVAHEYQDSYLDWLDSLQDGDPSEEAASLLHEARRAANSYWFLQSQIPF